MNNGNSGKRLIQADLKKQLMIFVSVLILIALSIESVFAYVNLTAAYNQVTGKAEENFDGLIQNEVKALIGELQINYNRYKKGEITDSQARAIAADMVRSARYDNSEGKSKGYFWADDASGKCVVHIDPKYEGLQRYDYKDEKGNYYIRNLIAAGNKPDGSFTNFWFTKPGKEGSYQKRGYTARFEPYGWYVSTGNYTEDTEKVFQTCADEKARAVFIVIGCGAALLLFCLWAAWLMATRISDPLKKITERLKMLSEGDFTSPVPQIPGKNETAELSRAATDTVKVFDGMISDLRTNMQKMADGDFRVRIAHDYPGDTAPVRQSIEIIAASLSKTMRQIEQASNQVSSGAGQLSVGAQSLSQGATEQAGSIEELSGTVSEVAEHVERNAANAENADAVSNQVGKKIQVSSEAMNKMVEAISEISISSSQIGKIIQTINDIAFQTNILALNAAVEASHAGEAGKGFAVVADEVRSLANKSAEAAKDSTALIENSIRSVEKGTKIAGEANESLRAVVSDAQQVAELIDGISTSSKKQAASIEEINQAIAQISSVVQTVSATAEESAAASEELDGQAVALRDLVNHFQCEDDRQS